MSVSFRPTRSRLAIPVSLAAIAVTCVMASSTAASAKACTQPKSGRQVTMTGIVNLAAGPSAENPVGKIAFSPTGCDEQYIFFDASSLNGCRYGKRIRVTGQAENMFFPGMEATFLRNVRFKCS